jgi:hypothetical protein
MQLCFLDDCSPEASIPSSSSLDVVSTSSSSLFQDCDASSLLLKLELDMLELKLELLELELELLLSSHIPLPGNVSANLDAPGLGETQLDYCVIVGGILAVALLYSSSSSALVASPFLGVFNFGVVRLDSLFSQCIVNS